MDWIFQRFPGLGRLVGAEAGGRWIFWRLLGVALAAGVIGMVLYLSWIPDPRFGNLRWMPGWLSDWADEYGRLRTAVPFVPLGVIAATWLYVGRRKKSDWAWTLLSLVGVVTVAELGQILLPKRVADWRDIVWGALGSAAGMGVVAIYSLIRNRNHKKSL